jgi:CubicO group peptidase (beta-lactamase class C family)
MKKVILLLSLVIPLVSSAQQRLMEKYIRGEFRMGEGFNGTALVAKDGHIIFQTAVGYKEPGQQNFLNQHSVFELASVSKQFTAMGILLLEENGKLQLTDTLRKFFPELPYNKVTIYQMLTHTSGLPDYTEAMESKWDHRRIAFNKDMIAFLAADKPKAYFRPGAKFDYSNTAYALLASVIEKVSGLPFKDYMAKNIFVPLHMKSTRIYNTRRSSADTIANYAYGFLYDDASKKYLLPDSMKNHDEVYYLDGIVGDGCVNSTTDDLLKWQNALDEYKLLKKENQVAMVSPHSLMDTASKTYYGYGVEVGHDVFGDFTAHNGSWPGYSTKLLHYTKDDLTVIVLSNNQYNADAIAAGLVRLAYNQPLVMPYTHQAISIDTSLLDRYTGTYLVPQTIELVKHGGKLYRHLPGRASSADVELKPESPTRFFYTNRADVQIEFETDVKGQVLKTWIINNGLRYAAKKL